MSSYGDKEILLLQHDKKWTMAKYTENNKKFQVVVIPLPNLVHCKSSSLKLVHC